MMSGKVIVSGKEYSCLIPETKEERVEGMDRVASLDDKLFVYLFCCPNFVLFRGAKRGNDIAFVGYDVEEDCFRIRKIAYDIYPDDVIGFDGTIMVIEDESGGFKEKGIKIGDKVDLLLDGKSIKDLLAIRDRFGKYKVKASKGGGLTLFEIAQELWYNGFRGTDLIEALMSLGISKQEAENISLNLGKEEEDVWKMG